MAGSVTQNIQQASRITILIYKITQSFVPLILTQTCHPTKANQYIWQIRYGSMQNLAKTKESRMSFITERLHPKSLDFAGENTADQTRTLRTYISLLRQKAMLMVLFLKYHY